MTTLRKNRAGGSAYMTPPPEAFEYDAEVTKEGVRKIQDRADKARGDDELETVEGYVGPRK